MNYYYTDGRFKVTCSEDNIKTDLREIECGGLEWIDFRVRAGGGLL
jgi:hypothetical protein